MAKIEKDDVRDAYMDVRSDSTDTNWALFGYEGDVIKVTTKGVDFEEISPLLTDEDRAFVFLRVISGDELSKRTKFVLITWCGNSVSPLKRARISADKTVVKSVVESIACEFMFSEKSELNLSHITEDVKKAGGANYGTGS